jgi:hypothetical protein
MSKRVVLVGHCGADSTYLKLAVKSGLPGGQIMTADSEAELKAALVDGADLVLVNRVVDYGFDSDEGVEIIRAFHKAFPGTRMMLVSNYPEAQAAAVEAGALPGFGKREIGSARVKALLESATATPESATGQRP